MDDITPPANRERIPTSWVFVGSTTLALGLLLWSGFFTDFSWAGVLADIVFPPLVGLLGLVAMGHARRVPDLRWKRLNRLVTLPSIVGGGLPVIFIVLSFFSPAMLGMFFLMDEILGETLIQRAISPDGSRIAEVYFRGVGAYAGGNGRILVRVRPRWLPFVERDVYALNRSDADETTSDYLYWVDNDTLFLSEKQRELKVGHMRRDVPTFVRIPLSIGVLLWRSIQP